METENNNQFNSNEDSAPIIDIPKYEYYRENEEYLIGYRPIKGKVRKYIELSLLNTKIISNEKKMFTSKFEQENFVEENFNKNFDIFTYLALSFEKYPPKIEYSEKNKEINVVIYNIKKGEFSFSLQEKKCEDEEFWNENIKMKLDRLEKKLENEYNKHVNLKKDLEKSIKEKNKELEEIKKKNKILKSLNEEISKSLSELEEVQKKAITQLNEVS